MDRTSLDTFSEYGSPHQNLAVEITEENLEDLLAYDDLFLDYFNAFLALPVFPQPLYYNRLTGTFLEVQGVNSALSDEYPRPVTPPYGATDEERERMLEWAKDERLHLFLRTQLFREFKLCKLLLRALDDQHSASRTGSSRQLRGYSRQTESYVSSLSNSADNSANDADFDDDNTAWGEVERSGKIYRYKRPGSRAVSLPTRLGLARDYGYTPRTLSRNSQSKDIIPGVQSASASSHRPDRSIDDRSKSKSASFNEKSSSDLVKLPNQTESHPSSAKSRLSASSSRKASRTSRHSSAAQQDTDTKERLSVAFHDEPVDFDVVYGEQEPEMNGEVYVNFPDDVVSDQQTETDVRQLEGKHKMTLQQMKEQILGSVHGMDQFKLFLSDTVGGRLQSFWLDCEYFKDSMEEYDEQTIMASRNTLFRDIQDQYRMTLTEDAKRQISKATHNVGLSHTVFIRTQYDVLRRLRAYWVPRFLIHKERMDELSVELNRELLAAENQIVFDGHDSIGTSFFPSISLVNSMPVRGDQIMHIANTTSWAMVHTGGRKYDERVKSAKPNVRLRSNARTIREKMAIALMVDKAAGGPLRLFLEGHQDGELLRHFLFWEAVQEYGMAEDRSADRLLRMCHAWTIFNKFIAKDSIHSIGVPPEDQDHIHQVLLQSRDFVEATVFNEAQELAVGQLEKAWIRFLKEDLKAFLDCHIREEEEPPNTAEEIEVYLDQNRHHLVVRRPRPWTRSNEKEDGNRYPPSTESERGRRLRTALSMAESIDEARRLEQRKRAKEKRKVMEKERRKAIKAAKQRLKDAKMIKKNVSFTSKSEDGGGDERGSHPGSQGGSLPPVQEAPEEQVPEEKPPGFVESAANKGLVTMFKKYLTENEGKDAVNHLNLYLDVDAYFNLADSGKNAKQKKEIQAGQIHKSYIEQGARKKLYLSDKIYARLKTDKDRPKSGTLKDIQHFIAPKLDGLFKSFWEHQAEELGVDNQTMAKMSRAEIALHSDDAVLLGNWDKKKKNGKDSNGGSPTSLPSIDSNPNQDAPPQSRHSSQYEKSLQSRQSSQQPELEPSSNSNIPEALLELAMSDDDFKIKRHKRPPRERSNVSRHAKTRSPIDEDSDEQDAQEGEDSARQTTSQSRRKRKPDGRAQPTREDKVDLLMALSTAAAGKLPMQMLHFYKYLVKHGEEDGVPFADKDLFFYCEVHKFKECSHQFADEEMLRRKVQSLLDCYLECSGTPHLQLDISNDIQQRTIRQAQKYLSGKDVNSTIFDEAQYSVFKELLPYWAGFQKNDRAKEETEARPLTRKEKERLKRLEEIMKWKPPSAKKISLPLLPTGSTIAAFTFTLGDGIKWREGQLAEDVEVAAPAESVISDRREKTFASSENLRNTRRNSVLAKA